MDQVINRAKQSVLLTEGNDAGGSYRTHSRENFQLFGGSGSDQIFGEEGNESLNIAPEDSLVFVMDVQRAFPARADGAPRLLRRRRIGVAHLVRAPRPRTILGSLMLRTEH